MKNRWFNLLFILLACMVAALSWHLIVLANTKEAASLVINILGPLNTLLSTVLFFVLCRYLIQLYLGRRAKKAGFRLQTKLVLSILPLTLFPAIIIFVLATRFQDVVLGNLVVNPSETTIIENTEQAQTAYLKDISEYHRAHGPELMTALLEEDRPRVEALIEKYGMDGVEFFRHNEMQVRLLNRRLDETAQARILESMEDNPDMAARNFDDGYLVMRFPYYSGRGTLYFLYVRSTPFSESFLFLRDSYIYLSHKQKKTDKLEEVNKGILLVATLAVIFGGVWTGLAFAKRFLAAFTVLIDGAERVSKGELETRIELQTGDEVEDVITAFNSMTRQLHSNQNELEERARDLAAVNTELSDQIQYRRTIMQLTKVGILSTDADGRILTHNPAVCRILDIKPPEKGDRFQMVVDPVRHSPLIRLWTDFRDQPEHQFKHLEILDGSGKETRHVAASLAPLEQDQSALGSLLLLEDLTELMLAQKSAAWQEVARRVAHEIKNPLTPIQLSIQRIKRKSDKGAPDLDKAIHSAYETIMAETDLLKNLVNEFSTFAKMPDPIKSNNNLADLVRAVCETYAPVYPKILITTRFPNQEPILNCDAGQIRQVLSNLIQNAAQASKEQGEMEVSVTTDDAHVVLTVSDQGVGIPESERARVFVPYFSKSPKGTGLGLAIVKRIVEDHNGRIHVEPNQPKGCRFIVQFHLPAAKAVPSA